MYGIYISTPTGGSVDNYSLHAVGKINTGEYYAVDGTKVVGNRGAAITDANTVHDVNNFGETETALNALGTIINQILAALRATTGHGLLTG
jgi:hypothetical protein